MKKLFLLFCLTIFTLTSYAQTQSKIIRPKKEKAYVYPSSIIKINTTSLLFKTVAVQYERKLASKWSFALGVLYRPSSKLLMYDAMAESTQSYLTPNAKYAYSTMKLSRLAITPEFKFFFKKTAPRGLYLSPFFRYRRDVTPFDFKYFASNISATNEKKGTAKITDRNIGVGVLFGLQILSKNKLAVDFWFLGPGLTNAKSSVSSKLNTSELNQIDKNSISTDLEEITSVAIKNDNNGFFGSSTGYSFYFRMIGVNIGYNF